MGEKYRATIYIEREIWDWMRKHAIDQHKSASEVIEQMLLAYKNQIPEEKSDKPRQSRSKAPKRV